MFDALPPVKYFLANSREGNFWSVWTTLPKTVETSGHWVEFLLELRADHATMHAI